MSNLDNSIYLRRREKLFSLLDDGVALIPSGEEKIKSFDTGYPFRQDSNFNYLTGFDEPESLLVLCPNNKEGKTALFLRPKDKVAEMWEGRRLGLDKAKEAIGVDLVFSIHELDKKLPELLENHSKVFLDLFSNKPLVDKSLEHLRNLSGRKRSKIASPQKIVNLPPIIGMMRLKKDMEEISLIRKASAISSNAHKAAMAFTSPGKNEYEVQALMEYIFKKEGAQGSAYQSIVAGGNNANILHYINNNEILNNEDLLLIDAGCEFGLYASDITRTFPVNGTFSAAQRDVYQIVIEAQKKAMEESRPGNTLTQNHDAATKVLVQGLMDLKVLGGSLQEHLEKQSFKDYWPHGTGHWLGLDVHDNSPYINEEKSDIVFEEGMVFTIEPGLYLPLEDQKVPEDLRGIGIRIEDDVLITKNGHEVLTEDVPKEIEAVEEACQKNYRDFL